eukprot:452753_1
MNNQNHNNNNNHKNNNNNNIEKLGKQTWEALHKLHSQNTSNSERTSADKFLSKYLPNQPCCWQIFSRFLATDINLTHKAHFFAANMLRSKIQSNLHEVPHKYRIGLRNMIMNTLINFNKKGQKYENVRTELSIALAFLTTQQAIVPNAYFDHTECKIHNVKYDRENVIKRVMMDHKHKVQQLYNQLAKIIIEPTQDIDGIKNNLFNLFVDIKKCDSFTMLHEINQHLMKLISTFDDINDCIKKQNKQFENKKSFLNQVIVAVNTRNKALSNILKQQIHMKNPFTLNEIQINIEKLQSKATCILELWSSDNDKQKISKQIDKLREFIKKKTAGLCQDFESWSFDEVIEWLVFINPKMSMKTLSVSEYCRVESDNMSFGDGVISIIFEYQRCESWQLECNNTKGKLYENMMDKLIMIDLNGSKLKGLNDCVLQLVGMEDTKERKIIVKGINDLIDKYGGHKYSKTQLCCICMMNQVNTCLVPCGHLCYCHECGKRSLNHTYNCPLCRRRILRMVTTYKGGVQTS